MSINYWDSLGDSIGQGIADFATIKRGRQLQDKQLANQEADRRRQIAMDNYKVAQAMAPGMLQAGQYEGAAKMLNDSLGELRAAGFNVSNNGVMGAAKQVHRPSAAPAAGPFGVAQEPQPKVSLDTPLGGAAAMLDERFGRLDGAPATYSEMMTRGLNPGDNIGGAAPVAPEAVTVRDFNNPQTIAAIRGGFGIQAPRPEAVKIGRTIGHYDEAGKFVVDRTEEDPMAEYRQETLDLRRQQLADQKAAREVAAADRAEARADRHQARADNRRRRTTTATIDRGGKPVTVLIDSETGDVIKEIGAKGYAPKSSTFNSAQAMSESELEAAQATGINPKSKFLSKKDAQRFNAKKAEIYAAKKRAASSASSGGSGGQGGGFNAGGFLSRPVK